VSAGPPPGDAGPDGAFFEEHGWIVLRGVLDGARLEALIASFDDALAPWLGGAAGGPSGARQLWQLPAASRDRPELLAPLRDELGARVAALMGAERLQLLQDTLILKPPRTGAAVELHQDCTYTGFLDPPHTLSVRLSLLGETTADGCLWVVDGSHRWGVQGGYAAFTDRLRGVALDGLPEELRARLESSRQPIELGPGEVSVHHGFTFHGSYENLGERPRKTIVAHVFDGACRLARERLPETAQAYFETDADGHLIGAGFPLLWRGAG
jgi:ectoine hydroxylase-related dioxygenase (phytanoyl-CoA dioxygenase family)